MDSDLLRLTKIDVVKYGGHSMRGASTSAAKRFGVPVNLILRQASWRSAQSFAKYYYKDLDKDSGEMAESLLSNVE